MFAGTAFLITSILLGAADAQLPLEPYNPALVGIQSVELRISDIDLIANLHGLNEAKIRKTIEETLRTGGFEPVLPGKGDAVYEIIVNMFWDERALLYAFNVRGQIRQQIYFAERKSAPFSAVVWQSSEPTGIIAEHSLHLLTNAVEKVTTEFVIDCLKAAKRD